MVQKFHIKQGDTRPSIKAILKDNMGDSRPLDGAEHVRFNMTHQNTDEDVVDNGQGTVLDEEDGKVAYTWEEGDTNLVGDHDAEFEIEYADGGVEKFPNNNDIIVTVHESVA